MRFDHNESYEGDKGPGRAGWGLEECKVSGVPGRWCIRHLSLHSL